MPLRSTVPRLSAGLSALVVASGLAGAAEPTQANLDTCTKAVNALGATMGHTEFKGEDGRTMYKFKLRTAGLDYDAVCDAATGVVGDVAPHRGPSDDAAG